MIRVKSGMYFRVRWVRALRGWVSIKARVFSWLPVRDRVILCIHRSGSPLGRGVHVTWELSVADLTGLQARFKDVKYLIVDEKSMVDHKTLGTYERLREIFPDKNINILPFGGLNVVVTGDNWQLQPVGGHPLFRASSDSCWSQLL